MSIPASGPPSSRPFEGKVALITGAARGQGRAHAEAFAAAGADIAICDALEPMPTVPYPLAGEDDLEEAADAVRGHGARCHAQRADVRDTAQMESFAAAAATELGGIDVVVANAGVYSFAANTWELTPEQWQVVLDVNLTGVWNTCRAAIPRLLQTGRGGSIALISSVNGFEGVPGTAHYTAAKHGLLGLMRTLALELAPHGVRVNTVHPTAVATKMVQNEAMPAALAAAESGGKDMTNLLPVELIEPRDVSAALLWLASSEARYVTGIALPVDAGFLVK